MNRQENSSFIAFSNKEAGLIMDDSAHRDYPIRYYNVIKGEGIEPKDDCSYYGFIYKGALQLNGPGRISRYLAQGEFFSRAGRFDMIGEGSAVIIEVLHTGGKYPETNFRAYDLIGGPIEPEGRLKYIDGCTDSLLIPPVKKGDPCLNHLHFPPNIVQTQHTHPSHRIGVVASGRGECITPFGNLPLEPGMIFVIKEWDGKTYDEVDGVKYPIGQHSFNTFDEVMNVIAFHPDSDFGPEDEEHPMINRTIVDGRSAKEIESIRTK